MHMYMCMHVSDETTQRTHPAGPADRYPSPRRDPAAAADPVFDVSKTIVPTPLFFVTALQWFANTRQPGASRVQA